MVTQNDSNFNEVQSTTRPPFFDGNYYSYWKIRIKIYLQPLDYEIREIVSDGLFMSTTKNEKEIEVPKPSCEWSEVENNKASVNSKTMNVLFCVLDKKEFYRVSRYSNAYEIWKKTWGSVWRY